MRRLSRETIVRAAREGRLEDASDEFGGAVVLLDCQPLYGREADLVREMFADGTLTFRHEDVDTMASTVVIRLKERHS